MTTTIEPVEAPGIAASAMIHGVNLTGPAGRLEALLNEGAPNARFAALVCHPHPIGGGSMHNKVVYHAMKAMNAPLWGLGWPVLRFNFRGVGLSEGDHDGASETGDVNSAADWLENEYKLPIVAVGFSFGAAMALKACCSQTTVAAVVALGLPTYADGRDCRYSFLQDCTVPKLFLSGDRDQFAPPAHLAQVAESASEPKQLVLLPRADHFFTGELEPMQSALTGWLKEQLRCPQ